MANHTELFSAEKPSLKTNRPIIPTSDGWRNRHRSLYTQYVYVHEVANQKLKVLLELYGCAFDDEFCYKVRGKSAKIVCRTPLWLGFKEPTQTFWREKHMPPRKGQQKLLEKCESSLSEKQGKTTT